MHLLAFSWILTINAQIWIAQNTNVDFVIVNTYGKCGEEVVINFVVFVLFRLTAKLLALKHWLMWDTYDPKGNQYSWYQYCL